MFLLVLKKPLFRNQKRATPFAKRWAFLLKKLFFLPALPQPTEEYPAILFKDTNYNNCSSSGFYVKIRYGHYHTWCKNDNLVRKRVMRFSSMLVLPGHNITFKACCPSGNEWFKMVSNIDSTPDLNHTVFYNSELSGNKGIWYTSKKALLFEFLLCFLLS